MNKRQKWQCQHCESILNSRKEKILHIKEIHNSINKVNIKSVFKCDFCRWEKKTTLTGYKLHVKSCSKNPQREKGMSSGNPISNIHRQKLSEAMKERHRKNLAAKWENPRIKRSWPEIFFSQVIENEFEDKNVDPEHPVGKYWIDFAWPHLMKAIEIDGQQHERYRHQIESDKKKDKHLSDQGWDLLRIKWSDMYENPKYWISVAKQFIDHRSVAQ